MSMSPDALAEFQRRQLAFAATIRDPQQAPPPEIPEARMAVYRELFFNGFESHLAGNFPVLRSITDDAAWEALVRDFMVRHRARTPLFTEIGQEFIDYLQHEREPAPGDPPFLAELAHWEYAELAVAISDADRELADFDPNGDLLEQHPVVAPTAWHPSYRFPVHRIGPDYLPETPPPEPTHLVVYRDREDAVHFLEINAVTQQLLTLLKENPALSGLDCLKHIAEALQHPRPQSVVAAGAALLADLKQRNILLGTRPPERRPA